MKSLTRRPLYLVVFTLFAGIAAYVLLAGAQLAAL